MIRMSVLYPATAGSRFDWDYYLNTHMELTRRLLTPLGMVRAEVDRGIGGFPPGTPAPFHAIAYLMFPTLADLQAAMGSAGMEIMADVPNYTDTQVVAQISEAV